MRHVLSLALAVGMVGMGLWLSSGLATPQLWLFSAGLLGLVGIATESCLAPPPGPEAESQRQGFLLWIAPGLLLVTGLWLEQLIEADARITLAVAMALLAGLLLLGLRLGSRPGGRCYRPGRFGANLIIYLLVFVLFALTYQTRERSAITATATGLISFLAALEVLRSGHGKQASGWPTAMLAGLIVAETTWAVNYWPTSALLGGALLLLTFYVFTGLLLAIREGGLDHRLLVEYGAVGVVGLFAIAWAMV